MPWNLSRTPSSNATARPFVPPLQRPSSLPRWWPPALPDSSNVSLLLRRRDRRRLGEPRRFDVGVCANLREFEGVASIEPRLRELERQLHAVDVTVIGVVG